APAAVLPGTATCGPFGETGLFYPVSGPPVSVRPLGPDLATNAYMDEMANSNYNSLQVSLRHTSANASLLLGYTYSKCMDNASQLEEGIDPLNYRVSKGLCAFDLTHNFVASYSYMLPLGKFSFAQGPVASRILKGWIVSGITTFATGLPVTISEGDDNSLLGATSDNVDEPNFTPGKILNNTNPRSGLNYFNTSLFSEEPFGQLGDSNRRFFHGPGLNNFDLALEKDISITESKHIQFRAEAFNLFNHAQFQNPDGNVNSGTFGLVTGVNAPRILQMALKFIF
ncbi:MAG: TonB-dependent receptor, partial [Terriglobia bacterium]